VGDAVAIVRSVVPALDRDRALSADIAALSAAIASGAFDAVAVAPPTAAASR